MLVTNFRFKYLVYRVACGLFQFLDVARIHPVRVRALRALEDTVNFIDRHMPDAIGFETQKEVTEYALSEVTVPGHYLEFGVYKGGTIRFIAKHIGDKIIHGFDSFLGLPEKWAGFNLGKAAFHVGGSLPRVPPNVQLHPGWFDQSVPIWLARNLGPVSFVHIDCDLYSSTKTIFDQLEDRLQPSCIILFDEYFNYPNWRNHEYKAFQEFVLRRRIRYTYIAYARQQVAVRIDSVDGANE
jgi:hypothetical protein